MPQYTIEGADPKSGQKRIVILAANDEADARRQARFMGLLVTGVELYSGAVAPEPETAVPKAAPLGASFHDPQTLELILRPMLVSAIANVVVGMFWATTCWGFIIGVAMTTVAVFEFRLYGQAKRMPGDLLKREAKRLGTSEIVVGIFNLVSLVCGLMVKKNADLLQPAVRVRQA